MGDPGLPYSNRGLFRLGASPANLQNRRASDILPVGGGIQQPIPPGKHQQNGTIPGELSPFFPGNFPDFPVPENFGGNNYPLTMESSE